MKANIIRIGNSRGIRLPKALLEECGFKENSVVEIISKNHQLIIKLYKEKEPRSGWAEAFQQMAQAGDDELLDVGNVENDWDDKKWEW